MRVPIVFLLTALAAAPLRAQTSTIIHLPGKTIEIVGLERWTPAMIQDSLDRYSPGDSLQSHACAAILRYKLHFADAVAEDFVPQTPDTTEYILVGVVEPQDSSRVHYRTVSTDFDTLGVQPQWAPLVRLIRHDSFAFQVAVNFYFQRSDSSGIPSYARSDSAAIHEVWTYLATHRMSDDVARARTALRHDPDVLDRMAAAATLLNGSQNDSTWWSLMNAELESDGFARATANQVLSSFATNRPRRVNWMPVSSTLHAILDGTDLSSLSTVMRVLVKTGARPEWASTLLRGGGHALLAYAGAEAPAARKPALALLRALRGEDLGTDLGAWRTWIESL